MESKTALIMANGTLVNTLKALQRNIKNNNDFKKLVEYFLDGNLKDWLNERYGYEKGIKALEEVNKDDPDFACKLCKAIGIDYTPSEPVNVALIEYEMRIRKALEKVTSDDSELIEELIANAGCTASTQSELDFLIKNGKKIIYLWGDSFKLPLEHNISYIGILGKPSVDIDLVDLDSLKSYGIKFENLNLPEQFERAEKEARRNSFQNANVGDYIKFGNYPQTSNGQNQPIEWKVLAIENNQVLVISRCGLEVRCFDRDLHKNDEFHKASNKWANSEIRQWLNDEFYNEAFDDQEKKSINLSNLSDVGTSDNIFFLSREEVGEYCVNDDTRKCEATDYAVNNLAWKNNNGFGYWWLRSPVLNFVSIVDFGGSIDYGKVDGPDCLVRPALWINL